MRLPLVLKQLLKHFSRSLLVRVKSWFDWQKWLKWVSCLTIKTETASGSPFFIWLILIVLYYHNTTEKSILEDWIERNDKTNSNFCISGSLSRVCRWLVKLLLNKFRKSQSASLPPEQELQSFHSNMSYYSLTT